MTDSRIDAVVVGAGVGGLSAAVVMARAGLSVLVVEGASEIGGAARTAEVTLPGFLHDVGAAVHPMAVASPFFRRFGLDRRVRLLTPELSYGHALGDGRSALAWRDLRRAARGLGVDGPAWTRLLGPLVTRSRQVARFTLTPVLQVPAHPVVASRFGLAVLDQGAPGWDRRWRGDAAPALLAGAMAHAIAPLPGFAPAAAGLALAVAAHAGGWPVVEGGTGAIPAALAADLLAHGGHIETGRTVGSIGELPASRVVLFDTGVPDLLRIAGPRIPAPLRAWLRTIRPGDGVGKIDVALDGPVPWRDPALASTATVHVGGTRAQIAASEGRVAAGAMPEHPYVLVAQPSVLDPSRAPRGKHVLWAYTHVPAGSEADPAERILRALEREAPGLRDRVLAVNAHSARDIGAANPNLAGGDIGAGAITLRQLLARPVPTADPWHLGRGVYLCSAAAVPGPGVHGMGGYLAARSALRRAFGITAPPLLT